MMGGLNRCACKRCLAGEVGVVHDLLNPPVDPGLDCSGDEPLTQQEFAKESDINHIMARVLKGNQELAVEGVGEYGDFSAVGDFQSSMELLERARAQFQALPALVRDRFGNDPVRFLEFIHDPNTTLEQANELGLLREESRKRMEAEKELARAQAAVAAAKPAVVVPPGGVVVETLKTT